jgi:hypothetical protein
LPLRCGSIAGRTRNSKDFCKGPGIPVSHKTSKFRIAVAGEQLDTVCCHGAECRCGGTVSSGSQCLCPKRFNFFAATEHGPCGERWHRAPTQTQLVFPHLCAHRDYTLLLLIQMHLIERKILASNRQALEASKTCSEKAARQQWLHVDIPIITEVDFSSAQAAARWTRCFLCVGFLHDSRFLKM